VPFVARSDATVLDWIRTAREADLWAGVAWPLSPDLLSCWQAEPYVHPFVLLDAALPVAYGEIWEDADENEAELARLVVDPAVRGRGIGRELVGLLVGEARRRGFPDVWLRVVPTNAAAIACYTAAGFERARADAEARFDLGQPRPYLWLRAGPSS
jgi:ribosomal protein S18 acetylase RimI-like enzyme